MDDNIYYNPEKFGLEEVGQVDWSDGSYVFDYTVVWRNAAGELYYGEDSGCSCPCPFEDQTLDDLTKATFHELAAHLQSRVDTASDYSYYGDVDRSSEATSLIERMRNGLQLAHEDVFLRIPAEQLRRLLRLRGGEALLPRLD